MDISELVLTQWLRKGDGFALAIPATFLEFHVCNSILPIVKSLHNSNTTTNITSAVVGREFADILESTK